MEAKADVAHKEETVELALAKIKARKEKNRFLCFGTGASGSLDCHAGVM
jgi:hypothetical protein